MKSHILVSIQKNFFKIVFSLVLISVGVHPAAQTANNEALDRLINYSSEIYGTNDVLVNGWKYYPEHYNAQGNPYFLDEEWLTGKVNVQGKTFENVKLLYDIVNDELILQQMLNNGSMVFVMLNKDFISSFTLDDHYFINVSKPGYGSLKNGFYEVVYDGDFKFLIRYDKAFVNQYTAQFPHGSFSDQRAVNYILENGEVEKIQSKKTLLKYFKPYRKQIRSFLRENNIRFNKATVRELHQLMSFCDQL